MFVFCSEMKTIKISLKIHAITIRKSYSLSKTLFLSFDSYKQTSLVISDASLDVREWFRLLVDAELSDGGNLLTALSFTIIDCSLLLGSVFLLPSKLLPSDVSGLEQLLNAPLLGANCSVVLSLPVKFGEDTWKPRCTKFDSYRSFSSMAWMVCWLCLISAHFSSRSSGMEFWLGGRGAARFFRFGIGGMLLRVFVVLTITPDESDEFSELVELYGDTDDIVCGRTVNRYSPWACDRYLTGASSLFAL